MALSQHIDALITLSNLEGDMRVQSFLAKINDNHNEKLFNEGNVHKKFCYQKGFEFGRALKHIDKNSKFGKELVDSVAKNATSFTSNIFFITSTTIADSQNSH